MCLGGINVISWPNSFIHSVSNKNTIKHSFSICIADNHTAAPIILIHKTSNHLTPLQPRISVNTHQLYDRRRVGIRIAQKKPLFVFHLRVLHIFDLHMTNTFGFHFSLFWHDLFDLRHIRLIAQVISLGESCQQHNAALLNAHIQIYFRDSVVLLLRSVSAIIHEANRLLCDVTRRKTYSDCRLLDRLPLHRLASKLLFKRDEEFLSL